MTLSVCVLLALAADPDFARPREYARQFESAVAASDRVLKVWLTHADRTTLLLPDRINENTLYLLRRPTGAAAPLVFLGSELIAGIPLAPGDWIVENY